MLFNQMRILQTAAVAKDRGDAPLVLPLLRRTSLPPRRRDAREQGRVMNQHESIRRKHTDFHFTGVRRFEQGATSRS